jgi:hypothetical protein
MPRQGHFFKRNPIYFLLANKSFLCLSYAHASVIDHSNHFADVIDHPNHFADLIDYIADLYTNTYRTNHT